MDSQNPDPLPDTSLPPPPPARFPVPADYYASPATDVSPLFPRWVPLGCGWLAVVVLVTLFAGGAIILKGGGGAGRIIDFFFQSVGGDLRQMMSRDVGKPDRDALDAEMKMLHDNISAGRVGLATLQPLLKSIGNAVEDKKVSASEVRQITRIMHDLNNRRPPGSLAPGAGRPPE